MTLQSIPNDAFLTQPFQLFNRQWLLVTGGDFAKGEFNTMTVSWGSLGILWNKPIVQVFIRPTRFTYEFLERYDTFTVTAFPDVLHGALQVLGSRSGRDGDKISEAGLTAVPSTLIAAPTFAEAELSLECRKIYFDDLKPAQFLDPTAIDNYPKRDFHRSYFGEILTIQGSQKWIHSAK